MSNLALILVFLIWVSSKNADHLTLLYLSLIFVWVQKLSGPKCCYHSHHNSKVSLVSSRIQITTLNEITRIQKMNINLKIANLKCSKNLISIFPSHLISLYEVPLSTVRYIMFNSLLKIPYIKLNKKWKKIKHVSQTILINHFWWWKSFLFH